MKSADWETDPKLEPPLENGGWDDHLSFVDPGILILMQDASQTAAVVGDYEVCREHTHLKNQSIDLAQADLTDRQLIAVSLVFFGGVKKNHAARAMKISSQAVGDHLKAALKKISNHLNR